MSERNGHLPNSKKTFVSGKLHPDIRLPFREISLAPTKSMNGEIEINEPVRVYDTSGPWGDPDFRGDVTEGLPPLRANWIRERADVEECEGRKVQPIDDGWFSKFMRVPLSRNAERPTPRNREQASNIQRPGIHDSRGESRCEHA